MPAPVGRDLDETRAQLLEWLPARLPGASELSIGELTGPGGTGFSSDTLLFDLAYRVDGEPKSRGLVVRIKPTGFQLFPDYDLEAQFAIMKALGPTDVAVPVMLWEETSGDVIGAPFYVMEQIEGHAPADNPPYTAEGWLREMSAPEQSELWHGYLRSLAAIHRLDPVELGLGFLARPELGATPLEQELRYYEDFYRWAYPEGDHPTVEPSLAWLKANLPPQPAEPLLCWGDSRIGNMLFRGSECVAVLDWEMARLGDPTMDLAWGLFCDRYHAGGNGLPRLPGFPERAETIALYEELAGRTAEHVEYYEVLAGMRFSVILIRLAKQLKHNGLIPEDLPFEIDNPVANLHRRELEALGGV
jgi:aminoglycoside phosphotransferase (APT) family kinase protein